MGVLGLMPFLAKHCPELLRDVPTRLKGLSGRTAVIDATLITQRFHFAPSPLKNRHVLGWYRLINALRSNDVNVICVFDGKERGAAKQREVQRRRDERAISVARGELEEERAARLSEVQTLIKDMQRLPTQERYKTSERLAKAISLPDAVPGLVHDQTSHRKEPTRRVEDIPHSEETELDLGQGFSTGDFFEKPLPSKRHDPELTQSAKPEIEHAPISPRYGGEEGRVEEELEPSKLESIDSDKPSLDGEATQLTLSESSEEDQSNTVAERLKSAYDVFQRSLPSFQTIHSSPNTLSEPFYSNPSAEQLESHPQFPAIASKFQFQLAIDEARAWNHLVSGDAAKLDEAEDSLIRIEERSKIIATSYRRRNTFPNQATYETSKTMLRSMGVPCLESSVPFEGEGLAAAIVLAGHADFVISEDTDVLLYGAPLIRGITRQSGPLMEVAGKEVQEALELSWKSFIDFGLLLGTDFTKRIKNVGPTRALKFIKAHGSIEAILQNETKYPPHMDTEEYLRQVEMGREMFMKLPDLPDPSVLQQGERDDDSIMAVLDNFGISRDMLLENDDFFSIALEGNYFGDDPKM